MNKNKILWIVILIIIILILLLIFIYESRMANWKYVENDSGIPEIEVEGIKYGQYGISQWTPSNTSELIKIGKGIYSYSEDINNIYILLWEDRREKVGARLFIKEDCNLPPFDEENVDMIGFKYPIYTKISDDTFYIESKDGNLIRDIFICMENVIKEGSDLAYEIKEETSGVGVGRLVYYNEDLPGLDIATDIYSIGDKYYMIANEQGEYAEISRELLSKITGFDMPEATDFAKLSFEEIYDFYGVDFN